MELTIGDYAAILRRRALVVIAVIALSVLAAVALKSSADPTFQAKSEVLVTPIIDPVSNTPGVAKRDTLINLDTEQRLASSLLIADQVRASLGIDDRSSRQLRAKVAVAQVPPTELLSITVRDDDPEFAKQVASAWADSYLSTRRDNAAAARRETTDGLERQIDDLIADLVEINARIATSAPGTPDRFNADAELEATRGQLSALQDNLAKVSTASLDPGTVINSPQDARELSPVGTKEMAVLVFGGIMAAIALALVIDRLDRRVRGVADLDDTGVTVLGTLPRQRADAVAANRLRSVLTHGETPPRCVLVCGDDSRATALVGAQLARAFAAAGVPTLAVSADPDDSEAEKLLGVSATPGLADVAIGDVGSLIEIAQAIEAAGPLAAVGSGTAASWRPGLVARPDAVRALDQARGHYDVVVLVAPSVLTSTTALDLAPRADATLLVVGHKDANADRVASAAAEFARVGVPVTGAVIVARK